jgi:hypothetical protein
VPTGGAAIPVGENPRARSSFLVSQRMIGEPIDVGGRGEGAADDHAHDGDGENEGLPPKAATMSERLASPDSTMSMRDSSMASASSGPSAILLKVDALVKELDHLATSG